MDRRTFYTLLIAVVCVACGTPIDSLSRCDGKWRDFEHQQVCQRAFMQAAAAGRR